jgi:tryptophan synthase alpha chain
MSAHGGDRSNNPALAAQIETLRARGEGVFMPFVVIGDPDLTTSMKIALALCDAGADIIEFGFPFSDPPADGPVIQAADERALAAGTTPADCLAFIAELRAQRDTPVALLLYFNIIMQHGVRLFYEQAAAAGVDAVLVADVPLEAAGPLLEAAAAHGIAPIFIASELSSNARLGMLAEVAGGYVYAVARIGITGEQAAVDSGLGETIGRIRAATPLPIFAGFGISSPSHVRAVLDAGADGAICGSAIVAHVAAHAAGKTEEDTMLRDLSDFATAMKAATRPAT